MNYRELGATGLKVSEIGLGCEGMMEENCAMTAKLFDRAESLGINYFDMYSSNPDLHRAIGAALCGRRDKFHIQAHIGSAWINGQYERVRKLELVKRAFDEQLERLGVGYIDVGAIHYIDALDDWRGIVDGGVLEYARELKSKGLIRHIGISSHNPQVALEAAKSGHIEVIMFSVNPCYDLLPATEDVEDLWREESYKSPLVNIDPDRSLLYETCQRLGVGITVMKPFGGGDLLSEFSPAGAALGVNQLIHYALTRPAVSTVLVGAHSVEQLDDCARYEDASDEERDYAAAFSGMSKVSWKGYCMYCGHCAPCPKHISVADVTKFLNLCKAQSTVPETVREHYAALNHHAGECIMCGACETRCPFDVKIRDNMRAAKEVFGY
ncbi:MAG: aldo/keto reductase [Clostridia bacterium]|nr:aldo/keto reductase [Clostridia bacterium]